jgi:hypothetical protein
MNLSNKSLIVFIYVFAALVILFSIIFCIIFNVPFSNLSKDPISVAEAKPYIGFISNVGAMFWSFTTAICFFTASVLPKKNNTSKMSYFCLFAGIISFFLLIDDFFLFHERIFPKLFHLDEKYLFGFYGILVAFYLIKFKNLILKSQYLHLIVALALFTISVSVDVLMASEFENRHYFEDIPKFFGIISWFCFHFFVCKNILQEIFIKEQSN